MKFKSAPYLVVLWSALALAVHPALRAADAPPPAPAEATAAPAKTAVPEKVTEAEKPAATDATVPGAQTAATPAPAEATTDRKSAETKPEQPEASEPAKVEAAEDKGEPAPEPGIVRKRSRHTHHNPGNDRVGFGQNSTLAAGEQAESVVSVFGSSTSAGSVNDAVVSVFGSSTSSGDVGNAVVSVLGSTRVDGGSVGDSAVAVLGSVSINGHVHGDVVAVLGNVKLGPDAVVDGDVVCVGGGLERDPKAEVHGDVQNVGVAGHLFNFDWLSAWVTNCFLFARPLAFAPHLLWAWGVALAFLGFYALVALVAPEGVGRCVETLEQRPGQSILAAVLTLLLTPIVFVLLALTLVIVIGVALIPLFSLGLFFAGIFGKVVMLTWLGRRITRLLGGGPQVQPVICVLAGGVIVLLLYTVPILGFVVYKLMGILGLGVVVYTLIRAYKSDREAKAAVAAAAASAKAAATAATAAAALPAPGQAVGMSDPAGAVPPGLTPPPLLPPVVSAATLPRAGFWLRLVAAWLDLIIVAIVLAALPPLRHSSGGGLPLWIAIYSVVMWATKGTTIGGIICGLRVVRLDDRPVDWSVAVIRGLAAFLSLAVAGLGFIWVAFDDDRQSWHDKIAGTTIVRVSRSASLV